MANDAELELKLVELARRELVMSEFLLHTLLTEHLLLRGEQLATKKESMLAAIARIRAYKHLLIEELAALRGRDIQEECQFGREANFAPLFDTPSLCLEGERLHTQLIRLRDRLEHLLR
jgi:hypothetical protein